MFLIDVEKEIEKRFNGSSITQKRHFRRCRILKNFLDDCLFFADIPKSILSEKIILKNLSVEFPAKNLGKDDADLLRACRRGDETAWNALVDRYQRLIFTVARRTGLGEQQAC